VHLPSKCPAEQYSTRLHARQARYEESEIDADESDEDPDSDCGDEDGLDEDIDASAHAASVHTLTAQDWKRVPAFSDIMHERHPNFLRFFLRNELNICEIPTPSGCAQPETEMRPFSAQTDASLQLEASHYISKLV
jgi:hypothetical protein